MHITHTCVHIYTHTYMLYMNVYTRICMNVCECVGECLCGCMVMSVFVYKIFLAQEGDGFLLNISLENLHLLP